MFLLVPIMAFLSRCCGASWCRFPMEWVFALPFGYLGYLHSGLYIMGALSYSISYFGMQLGHSNFFQMEGVDITNDKPEDIERITRPVFIRFGGNVYSSLYSWFCMGLKGGVIGLAAFPYGFALVALWPLAYWLGFRYIKTSVFAEYLSGAFAGLIVWASV